MRVWMIRSMLSDWWLTMPVCAWHLSSRSLRSWLCITACVKQAGFIYYYYVKKKKKNYLVIFFLVDPILHPPGNDVPNFPPRKLDWQGERLWIEHLCTRGGDTERGRVVLLVCQGSLTKQIEMHASSSGGRKKRPS